MVNYVVNMFPSSDIDYYALYMLFQGGIYLFQLSDWYISAFALLFGSALECVMVCWIYG